MNTVLDAPLLGRMLRPLATRLQPDLLEALASMSADPVEQEKYEDLAARNEENLLTEAEKAELESIVSANRILSTLKTEARTALSKPAAS